MRRLLHLIFIALFAAAANPLLARSASAHRDDAAGAADKAKAKQAAPLTFVVLDFHASAPGNADLGKQVARIVSANLDDLDGFTQVNRVDMDRVLKQQKLSLTGDASREEQVKIGNVVGAKILIVGDVFPSQDGKSVYIIATMIGTETTLSHAHMMTGDKDTDVFALAVKLSEKLREELRQRGPKLIARNNPIENPIAVLKRALAGRKLPKVAVHIHEEDRGPAAVRELDPAAQTKVRDVLKQAGFTIIEGNAKFLDAAGVTLDISGNGSSAYADRIGDMINCTAHLEVTIKDRQSSEILFSKEVTTRAVDLAQPTAAKTALERAGEDLALKILRHFDETLPPNKPAKVGG